MNHLHEVLDAIESKRATVQDTIPEDKELGIVKLFLSMAKDAVCFNAGDGIEIGNLSGIAELIRLPFNVCWVEFFVNAASPDNRRVLFGAMCEMSGTDINVVPIVKNTKNQTWHIMDVMVIRVDVSTKLINYLTTPEMQNWYTSIGGILVRFLSALNCTNVRAIEESPPAALNKARIRRGKQPLFSTWTLSISIPKDRRDSSALGGSHASPRVHLRRGHPREYRPGSWTWVQPCAVGAKENGMIHKDYKAVHAGGRA